MEHKTQHIYFVNHTINDSYYEAHPVPTEVGMSQPTQDKTLLIESDDCTTNGVYPRFLNRKDKNIASSLHHIEAEDQYNITQPKKLHRANIALRRKQMDYMERRYFPNSSNK